MRRSIIGDVGHLRRTRSQAAAGSHFSHRLPQGSNSISRGAADNLRSSAASSLRESLKQRRRCQGNLLMMHGYDKNGVKCPPPLPAATTSNQAWARLSP